MGIHKKHKHKGVWWRPNFSNNKIPGTLEIIQNRSITLRMNNLLPTKDGIHHLPDTMGTILGKTLKKEPVTLIDCQHFFGDVYYSPLALVGRHYKDFDDIKFNSIKIFYTLLTEWAFEEERPKAHGILCEIKELGINIVFNIDFKKRTRKQKKSREEIISSITINSENSKNLHEWWDIIILLRNFIILGLNVPVYPCSFFGINNKKEVKIYRTTNTNFGSYLEQLKRKGYLFRLKDIKNNLHLYLSNLIKKSENLNRIMTNYYSILNNPEIYNVDKFLNLTSILEGYHRYNMINEEMKKKDFFKFKKEIIKKSKKFLCNEQINFINNKIYDFGYEKSLNKRLVELLDKCESIIPIEKSEKKTFIDKIVKNRNIIAHGLKEEKKKMLMGDNLYKALDALEFLFVASVLKEIGFEDELLNRLLSGFNKFNWPYNDITRLFKI